MGLILTLPSLAVNLNRGKEQQLSHKVHTVLGQQIHDARATSILQLITVSYSTPDTENPFRAHTRNNSTNTEEMLNIISWDSRKL